MDLNIIRVDGILAPCKFHLMTKDGVYLMEVPRLVDDLVMAAANRRALLAPQDRGHPLRHASPGTALGMHAAQGNPCGRAMACAVMPWWHGVATAPHCVRLLQSLPRRAEVIVECDGDVGERYYLASGAVQNFGPACAPHTPSFSTPPTTPACQAVARASCPTRPASSSSALAAG